MRNSSLLVMQASVERTQPFTTAERPQKAFYFHTGSICWVFIGQEVSGEDGGELQPVVGAYLPKGHGTPPLPSSSSRPLLACGAIEAVLA